MSAPHLVGRLQHALGDHALALAEQVRQEALIGDLEIMGAVGDHECDRLAADLTTEPVFTRPPTRSRAPGRNAFSTTSDGL